MKDEDGDYVRSAEVIENSFTAVTEEQEYVDTYYTDNAGTKEVATPKVKNDTYWYENGTNPVYSEYGTYQPISGVTQYYTRSGNSEPFTYTEVSPTLNGTYYYKTGNQVDAYSNAIYNPVENVTEYYYNNNGTMTSETPVLVSNLYYKNGTEDKDIYVEVHSYDAVVLGKTYYTSNDGSKVEAANPTLDATYYYKTGNSVEKGWVQEYYSNTDPSKVFYTYDGSTYTKVDNPQWNNLYWVYYSDKIDEYAETTTLLTNVDQYYNKNGDAYTATNVHFTQSYYYIDGTETVDKYEAAPNYVESVNTYYMFGWHNVGGNSVEGYYEYTGNVFSKEYYYVTGKTDEYLATTTYTPGETYYTNNNGTYTETAVQFNSQDYYYADGTTTRFDSANGQDWNAHEYFTDANGVNPAETIQFDGTYYIQDYNYTYTAYNAETDEGEQRWAKKTIYVAAETPGTGNYCPTMEDKEYRDITESHDYRGWHQFVLNAYAANTNEPVVPVRSFIRDSDWWTICLPYNLTKKEVMLFYGDITANENGAVTTSDAVPQLCVLSNVVRDESRRHITLNFSDNLMTKKFQKNETTKIWEPVTGDGAGAPGDDDVVLHAGVPYLIKPVFKANANRQFDVYGDNNVNTDLSAGRIAVTEENYPGLNAKLAAAQEINGIPFREMQEKNIYTVPALLPANDDGSYTGTEEAYTYEEAPFEINGKKYVRSKAFDYTFVGSLAKAVIPPFSYFLGYTTKACFIYADYTTVEFEQNKTDKTPDYKNRMLWNNNSCVICPNMLSESAANAGSYNLGLGSHDGLITQATGKQAAQWKIYGTDVTPILSDDIYHTTSVANAKPMDMMFAMDFALIDVSQTTGIKDIEAEEYISNIAKDNYGVYTINGRYVGESLRNLPKGVYIVNGKKYVVK